MSYSAMYVYQQGFCQKSRPGGYIGEIYCEEVVYAAAGGWLGRSDTPRACGREAKWTHRKDHHSL